MRLIIGACTLRFLCACNGKCDLSCVTADHPISHESLGYKIQIITYYYKEIKQYKNVHSSLDHKNTGLHPNMSVRRRTRGPLPMATGV